jgi:4-amino-4-deoxy-L-arabinose transferase-like glycosyltransferase
MNNKVSVLFLTRPLTYIMIFSIIVRLAVAIYMGDHIAVLPGIYDQISYDILAQSILDGKGYQFTENWYPFTPANTPTAHWSFLYPLYLASIYLLTGHHPLMARIIQAITGGALFCLLIYLIGRRLFSERIALFSAALASMYGYFIYYNAALMTETLFIIAVLLSLYLCLEIKRRPSWIRWFMLGLALGIATLLRQTALLLLPVFVLWLYWELRGNLRLWHLAVPFAAVFLLLVPWTVRNYGVYHRFLLLNSNSGYALYASNNPNLGTKWQNDKIVVPIPAEFDGLNEAELDQALQRRALQFIIADPGRYLRLTLDKSLEYFKFWPSGQSSFMSNLVRVMSFGLYLPFMLWGLFLSLPEWRKYSLLYLFAIVHSAIYLLSWPAPRYRLPVDAVMMLFAGYAVYDLVGRLQLERLIGVNRMISRTDLFKNIRLADVDKE